MMNEINEQVFVLSIDMEQRSPEQIAREAVMQINMLFEKMLADTSKEGIKE